MAGEVDLDAGRVADGDASDDDPRDQLDELRVRIRSGDLSHSERDQLDQLVFVVALADRRSKQAVREFPGEVAVQRALAAEAWSPRGDTAARDARPGRRAVSPRRGAPKRQGPLLPRS